MRSNKVRTSRESPACADSWSDSAYLQCRWTYSWDFSAASSPEARASSKWVTGINLLSSLNTESAEKEQWDSSHPGGMKLSTFSSPSVCCSIAVKMSGIKKRFSLQGELGYRPR
jgi:hypothetical protein